MNCAKCHHAITGDWYVLWAQYWCDKCYKDLFAPPDKSPVKLVKPGYSPGYIEAVSKLLRT